MTAVFKVLLYKNELSINKIDWLISHQANLLIIEAPKKSLELKPAGW